MKNPIRVNFFEVTKALQLQGFFYFNFKCKTTTVQRTKLKKIKFTLSTIPVKSLFENIYLKRFNNLTLTATLS
jgi:hypothetical protein